LLPVSSRNSQQILVFDYDRTLTLEDLVIPSSTIETLKLVHEKKLATLGVVSGRELKFLKVVNESVSQAFSFLVAENGACVYRNRPHSVEVIGEEWSKKIRNVLSSADLGVHFGEIIAAGPVENTTRISETLTREGIQANIVPNRDSVMVVPPGVDKGSGVLSAISHYGNRREIELTCFGDGENDLSLFEPADVRVAVANAVQPLKDLADVVTTLPGGLGVEEYLRNKFMDSL
jgi:hydroxymethylpyrimidine pyrophosphatase-like HAD family hydrolase